MLLVGWGKKAREIGYYGISKCPNCKNYTHFSIYELHNNIKLYFVTVAKYNKKRYLVCPVCEYGIELSPETFDEVIKELPQRFSKEVMTEIWNYISKKVNMNDEINSKDQIESLIYDTQKELIERYGNEKNVNNMVVTYFTFLLDKDKAR